MKKPDLTFLGIGAAKSGTTWLAECLQEHPEIFIPYQKEICFFDWEGYDSNYDKGFEWYSKYFSKAQKKRKLGEFSTHYMYFNQSCGLIKKHYPNIKILVCLRKPEDLAYSLYWWKKANYESSSVPDNFEDALKVDPEYIERGYFYKQLKPYFDIFPRENIKVILLNEVKDNPEKVFSDVCNFIGVDSAFIPKSLRKNVNHAKTVRVQVLADFINSTLKKLEKLGYSRFVRSLISSAFLSNIYTKFNKRQFDYPKMRADTKELLKSTFKDDINLLESLLGKDLTALK